jgi:hypothetical protein
LWLGTEAARSTGGLMTERFTMPNHVLEAAKLLFPTLDFSRIYFYYDAHALEPHTQTYLTRTEIIFYPHSSVRFDPNLKETLKAVCHELVHALQGQTLLKRMVHLAAQYPCTYLRGNDSSATGNCIERDVSAGEKIPH